MTADARLTIDLDALAANYTVLCGAAGSTEIAPVVKADGYGLGAVAVSRRLRAEGASRFFVARISEGEALRQALGPDAEILVFDGCPRGAAERMAAAALVPVLNSPEQIEAWSQAGHTTPLALQVDTGMNRLGLSLAQAEQVAAVGLDVGLVMSHLSCANEPEHPLNRRQCEAMRAVAALFPDARASLANSGGLFLGPDYLFDVARPGISLFGGGPQSRPDPRIAAVATFEAPILQVRDVPARQTIGYGATFQADKPVRAAIVAAGYADGVLRAQSPGGYGWLEQSRLRLLGRVSMDLIALDVSDCAAARPGAMVELLGPNVLLDETAQACGLISYELLTGLSRRARRIYRGEAA
jgi:alanine racemase